jgi:hypothetical protein
MTLKARRTGFSTMKTSDERERAPLYTAEDIVTAAIPAGIT